ERIGSDIEYTHDNGALKSEQPRVYAYRLGGHWLEIGHATPPLFHNDHAVCCKCNVLHDVSIVILFFFALRVAFYYNGLAHDILWHKKTIVLEAHNDRLRSEEHTSELQSRENLVC